jgi:uncharacterized protein YdeI (YjbR/CyaY-like superfamily)
MNPNVDAFIQSAEKWQEEMALLRNILLDCSLMEEYKWKQPCYSFQNSNVVIIGPFKDFVVLGFFKGALLSDPENVLVKPGVNSQSTRMFRFTNVKQILELESIIKAYVYEAIEVEKAGLKVELKKTEDYNIPEELISQFEKDPKLKVAFSQLTPGRQRAYLLHFSEAKQSATRTARIEKYTSRILKGKGINDCVCGLSKRMPNCDGSHKNL